MQFDFSVVIVDKGLVAVLEGVSCKKKYEGIFFLKFNSIFIVTVKLQMDNFQSGLGDLF